MPLLEKAYSRILNCDFIIGNPETPFAEENFGYTNERYCFNTPESALKLLKKIGFDLMTFAKADIEYAKENSDDLYNI